MVKSHLKSHVAFKSTFDHTTFACRWIDGALLDCTFVTIGGLVILSHLKSHGIISNKFDHTFAHQYAIFDCTFFHLACIWSCNQGLDFQHHWSYHHDTCTMKGAMKNTLIVWYNIVPLLQSFSRELFLSTDKNNNGWGQAVIMGERTHFYRITAKFDGLNGGLVPRYKAHRLRLKRRIWDSLYCSSSWIVS